MPAPNKPTKATRKRITARRPSERRPLFTSLDLDELSNDTFTEAMVHDSSAVKLFLTIRWTPGRRVFIDSVGSRVGEGPWFDALKGYPIDSSYGSVTLDIGSYPGDSTVTVYFHLTATTAVPKAIAIVSQELPQPNWRQVAPPSPGTKELGLLEEWLVTDAHYRVQLHAIA